LAHRQTRETT